METINRSFAYFHTEDMTLGEFGTALSETAGESDFSLIESQKSNAR